MAWFNLHFLETRRNGLSASADLQLVVQADAICNFSRPCVHVPRLPDGFGCVRPKSSPLTQSAVQIAGIEPIGRHDLRHTFGARLVRADVDIVIVQNLLGTSRITMTARYAHSLSDVKMAAVSKPDLAAVDPALDLNRIPSPCGLVVKSEAYILRPQHRPVAQLVRALP
jgi:hypothetical protein